MDQAVKHYEETIAACDQAPTGKRGLSQRSFDALENHLALDETGAQGQLRFRAHVVSQAPSPDANGPSLFQAIQDQLGLNLERRQARDVEVLVVEYAEKPFHQRSARGGGDEMDFKLKRLMPWLALSLPTIATSQTDVSRMEQTVQSYVARQQFMGSVLVALDQQVLLDKGYGFANLEWRIPDSPETSSFSIDYKTIHPASILLLEEQGKLGIDQTLKEYIPDEPEARDRITIYK